MSSPIQTVVVLGAGSAGHLSAVAIRRLLPEVSVKILHSERIPVIGVGESTTAFFPSFLHHHLGLDQRQFYDQVRPVWKMGLRLEWGSPGTHFNYSFDLHMNAESPILRKRNVYYCMDFPEDAGHFSALMDRSLSPLQFTHGGHYYLQEGVGYHIDNQLFLEYLKGKALQLGTEIITGDVVDAPRNEAGDIECLKLEDGRQITADLFVDCSGFGSLLLGKALEEPYVSYTDALYADRAAIGSWQRTGDVQAFTTAETMNHGWCWRIELMDRVTRGYVYSSAFCSEEEAIAELREKNPLLGDDIRVVEFPSGRYENFWRNNVVAIGNACGFVEPLEATALHLIGQQLLLVCGALRDNNLRVDPRVRKIENGNFRSYWNEVRDFLALHFKYNHHLDTPYWRHCRENTPLGTLEPMIELYKHCGPSRSCAEYVPRTSMFDYNGYMIMLLGQNVDTDYRNEFTAEDLAAWDQYRNSVRHDISSVLTVDQALQLVHSDDWQWPQQGF